MSRPTHSIRVGPIGTVIFGILLFIGGYFLRDYLGETDSSSSREAIMGNRVGLGLMIVGGIFVVGNLLWFCLIAFFLFIKRQKK